MIGTDPAAHTSRGRSEAVVALIIVVLLLAIMGPLIRRTYQTSLAARCQARLRHIYAAVQTYALSYGGLAPAGHANGRTWRDAVDPLIAPESDAGVSREERWTCPAGGGYVGNVHVFGPPPVRLGGLRLKREVGVAADAAPTAQRGGTADFSGIGWPHRGATNVVYVDGRVRRVPRESAGRLERHWDSPQ